MIKVSRVIDDRDPFKQGRVQVEGGKWLCPVSTHKLFQVPPIGTQVVIHADYYIGIYDENKGERQDL